MIHLEVMNDSSRANALAPRGNSWSPRGNRLINSLSLAPSVCLFVCPSLPCSPWQRLERLTTYLLRYPGGGDAKHGVVQQHAYITRYSVGELDKNYVPLV